MERQRLEEDTVPRKRYQELQKKMNTIHEAEVEAHEKFRKAEEKADKVMNKLKLAYNEWTLSAHCTLMS